MRESPKMNFACFFAHTNLLVIFAALYTVITVSAHFLNYYEKTQGLCPRIRNRSFLVIDYEIV